jgi:hypothetical protein
MKKVFCVIPNAGLGNKLFVICRALLFGSLNDRDVIFLNTFQIKIGPYIRNEKSKRKYSGFFKFQKRYLLDKFCLIRYSYASFGSYLVEPEIIKNANCCEDVVFDKIPHYSNYFAELIPYRLLIKGLLFNQLKSNVQQQILNLPSLDVSVHVRLGDFKLLDSNADFRKVGSTRSPIDYYLNQMQAILSKDSNATFTIFSDGYAHELTDLLNFPNTHLFSSVNDIVDLYQMSKSRIIITSAGSTYSYWAAFMSDGEVIQHPYHFCRIR